MSRSTRLTPAISLAAAVFAAACADSSPSSPEQQRDACARLGVPGTYAGDVSLARGEAVKLASATQLCLALPGSQADAYALAFVDTRLIEAARTAPEPTSGDSFRVTIGAAGSTRGTRLVATDRRPAEPSDVREAAVTADPSTDPYLRATPWAVGDTFRVLEPGDDAARAMRVQRVYDGWLVIATRTDTAEAQMPGMMANLDAVWPTIRSMGIPLLRKILADTLPVTSAGSGQLLVSIRTDIEGAAGIAFGAVDGTRTYSHIVMLPYSGPSYAGTVQSILFHEITHTFQRQFITDTRPAGTPATRHAGATRWGAEGGARMMEAELARRAAGLGWGANWDFRTTFGPAQNLYARFALTGTGAFIDGYSTPAGFLRDLVERRVRHGEAVDEALSAVMRGAVEGWFGHVPYGPPDRTGLAARMRASLGAAWEPADALLTWTLSHAADDRTPSATFQDAGFLRAWDSTDPGAWPALATLAPGSPAVTIGQERGSTGFLELAGGGTYALGSTVDGVGWMIVRLK